MYTNKCNTVKSDLKSTPAFWQSNLLLESSLKEITQEKIMNPFQFNWPLTEQLTVHQAPFNLEEPRMSSHNSWPQGAHGPLGKISIKLPIIWNVIRARCEAMSGWEQVRPLRKAHSPAGWRWLSETFLPGTELALETRNEKNCHLFSWSWPGLPASASCPQLWALGRTREESNLEAGLEGRQDSKPSRGGGTPSHWQWKCVGSRNIRFCWFLNFPFF